MVSSDKFRLTSNEVMQLTGITARQLQWWDECGIVVPQRLAHRRLYSLADLAEVSVICNLRGRGFSLQKVRRVIQFLQREMGKRLVDTVSKGAGCHLLTDGRNIFLEDSARQLINVLKNSRQPMLAISLSDTVREIKAEIKSRQLGELLQTGAAVRKPKVGIRKGNRSVPAEARRMRRSAS